MGRNEPWRPTWSAAKNDWMVDFRVEGKRFRRGLGIRDENLRQTALNKAQALYKSAWGEALTPRTKDAPPSFKDAADLYVQEGGEKRFLDKILKHFGPHVRVDEISHVDIARAARAIYPQAKPETVRRQLRVPIRAVQNFAAGKRREKLPDTRRTRWLTPEEAENLLVVAANPDAIGLRDPNLQTLRKIAFMLGTGAGPGETMSALGENWNPATREWWLEGTKTVFRARYVLLPTRAVELIGHIPQSGPAFPAPDGQSYTFRKNRGGQMAVAFNKVRDAAGFGKDVTPYVLRHTRHSWAYSMTKDWGDLLDQGGWNRSDTANRYRKITPDDLGHRLLAHGWDFRRDPGPPVRFGEKVSLRRP
ncbi:Phage integrase family protein [Roseovarius pacificus]|uniref:Phage integrase family protein n=1 Tax=Roseovarius pacificus TaxID=337701 RepID=A0A1M7FWQ4_9RHOB|nr:tyrosine-type recombinase/integrase [Roseovarius pacificus]SHM08248.1 Phage integrase family protein [Roseovarius pacificus]